MKRKFVQLQCIEHNEKITEKTHDEFLYRLENALLLALCERGSLTLMQYRYAQEKLKQQRTEQAKDLLAKEENR